MMPLLSAPAPLIAEHATSPTGTGEAPRAGATRASGAAASGEFAELFAAMVTGTEGQHVVAETAPSVAVPEGNAAGTGGADQTSERLGDPDLVVLDAPETVDLPATAAEGRLALGAHQSVLASRKNAADAAVPGRAVPAPTGTPTVAPVAEEIEAAQASVPRATLRPQATGSPVRESFPIAVAPLPSRTVTGEPSLAANVEAGAEVVAMAGAAPGEPLLQITGAPLVAIEPSPMAPPTETGTGPREPHLPISEASRLEREMSQPGPSSSSTPGTALSVSAAEGSLSGEVPPPAAATPHAAPVQAPAGPLPTATPATEPGTGGTIRHSTDAGTVAMDALQAPRGTDAQGRPQAAPPLHRQLLGPITTLAAGPNGERTLSVNIAPEALGPITVKAHLGAEGIRMDLSAPTEAGREALRAMLPELRRELAATGGGNITVGTGSEASATAGGQKGQEHAADGSHRPFDDPATGTLPAGAGARPQAAGQEMPAAHHAESHLDVMA